MSMQIMNGGVLGGILRAIADESPELLTPEDQARLEMLESLPKGVWVDLDEKGNPISRQEARQKEAEHLSRFTTPDGKSITHG